MFLDTAGNEIELDPAKEYKILETRVSRVVYELEGKIIGDSLMYCYIVEEILA